MWMRMSTWTCTCICWWTVYACNVKKTIVCMYLYECKVEIFLFYFFCSSASSVQHKCLSVGIFRHSTSRNIPNSLLSSGTASGCPAHGWKGSGGFVSPGEPERRDNAAAINILLAVHSLLWIAVLGIIKGLPLFSTPSEASRLFWCLREN